MTTPNGPYCGMCQEPITEILVKWQHSSPEPHNHNVVPCNTPNLESENRKLREAHRRIIACDFDNPKVKEIVRGIAREALGEERNGK